MAFRAVLDQNDGEGFPFTPSGAVDQGLLPGEGLNIPVIEMAAPIILSFGAGPSGRC